MTELSILAALLTLAAVLLGTKIGYDLAMKRFRDNVGDIVREEIVNAKRSDSQSGQADSCNTGKVSRRT